MKYLQRHLLEDPTSLRLYSFLEKLQPETLLNGCFCFVLPSVETGGKKLNQSLKITPYPADKYEIKFYYSANKTRCGMFKVNREDTSMTPLR